MYGEHGGEVRSSGACGGHGGETKGAEACGKHGDEARGSGRAIGMTTGREARRCTIGEAAT